MSSGRKILYGAVVSLLVLAVICLVLTLAAQRYLPVYLTGLATEKLKDLTGITGQIRVRQAWLHGAELSDIRIGPPDDPVLEICTVQIAYSPMHLYRTGQIDLVRICGLNVHAQLSDGRLQLKNRKMMDLLTGRQPRPQGEAAISSRPPLSVRQLLVAGDLWVDGLSARREQIPFRLDIKGIGNRAEKAGMQAVFTPRGQEVALTARMSGRRMKLDIDIRDLALEAFSGFQLIPARVQLGGCVSLRAAIGIDLKTPNLFTASARCRIEGLKAETGRFRLRSRSKDIPFLLNIAAQKPGLWKISGSGLSVAAPVPVGLDELALDLTLTEEGLIAAGGIGAVFFPDAGGGHFLAEGLSVKPSALLLNISGEYSAAGNWRFGVSTREHPGHQRKPVLLHGGELTVKSGSPSFSCRAKGQKNGGQADMELEIPGLEMVHGISQAGIDSVRVESRVQFAWQPRTSASGHAQWKLIRVGLQSKTATMAAGKIQGRAAFAFGGINDATAEGRLEIADGRIDMPGNRMNVSRISAEIPLRWPFSNEGKSGRFSTGPISLQGRNLGTLKGSLRQTALGLAFKADFRTGLVSELKSSLQGTYDVLPTGNRALHLKFDLARAKKAPEIDVGRIAPAAEGLFAGGGVHAWGQIDSGIGGIGGRFSVSWEDGWLRMPGKKMHIEGIRAALNLPELPKMRSAPAQPFVFDRATMGDLAFENGRIEFQLESRRSLLIEKSYFQWCRGIIEAPALRIAPDTDDYLLTLYCDRLNLADILDQLGIDARGKGTLNGRIPVSWSHGRMDFRDGFLFSTPGEGGKIRILAGDILTAGVTPGSSQYNQMELASEALKDYDYTWARLNMNTEGDDLLVRLQFDGKPAGILPFVYRKEKGGFVRTRDRTRGSHFQGIRLDVNFRLPLNRLLHFSNIFPMMK